MKEPKLKIGFIIFNDEWKEELKSENDHRKTAFNWIKNNNMLDVYKSVVGKNEINDEEDFLIEYIGAIKLYAYMGNFYCRVPRMSNPEKNYLKRYFSNIGYKVISNGIYEEEKQKIKTLTYQYNKTVINNKNKLIYNPVKDGD